MLKRFYRLDVENLTPCDLDDPKLVAEIGADALKSVLRSYDVGNFKLYNMKDIVGDNINVLEIVSIEAMDSLGNYPYSLVIRHQDIMLPQPITWIFFPPNYLGISNFHPNGKSMLSITLISEKKKEGDKVGKA